MFNHETLLNSGLGNSLSLPLMIRKGAIKYAGNKKLKIYGTLACKSGKRMKLVNRLFFTSKEEAINTGYRPCGHCMKMLYQAWKAKNKMMQL